MTRTIYVEFDAKDLPAWARKHKEVVWLCERNLSFLINVQSANFADYKRFLKREAKRIYEARHHS